MMNDRTMQTLTRVVLAKLKTSRTVATWVGSLSFFSAACAAPPLGCGDSSESEAAAPFRVRSSVPDDADLGFPASSLASFGGSAPLRAMLLLVLAPSC